MANEIERKFLINNEYWQPSEDRIRIRQGYLCLDKDRTVRIRIAGNSSFITIKGRTVGITRSEFEYEISNEDANQMIQMCTGDLIEKVRHRIFDGDLLWEVDVFEGANEGLVVAEIELTDEHQEFQIPRWVGVEVSDNPRYFNSSLVIHPFGSWEVQK